MSQENQHVEEVWRCEQCGEIHDDEDEASECCPPEITALFRCTACRKTHQSEEEAEGCCPHDADSNGGRLWMASMKELERNGQCRLF